MKRFWNSKIISSAAAVLTAGLSALYAYYYSALPFDINAEAGAVLSDAGFANARLVETENGVRYYLGSIPIKSARVTEQERRYVIPGGEPFGIKVLSDGVMVISAADGSPADKAGLREGDVITSVNDVEVYTNDELAEAIQEANGSASLVFRRGESELSVNISPQQTGSGAKIGAWVRDSAAGIGTLTFVDPKTGTFGGLGHAVNDAATGEAVPLKSGEITAAEIYDIIKGEKGSAGELCGAMMAGRDIGAVLENTPTGVFGEYFGEISKEPVPVAFMQEVKTGAATVLTTIDGCTPREYSIEIERINLPDLLGSKGMLIRITDPELLEKTGGIVRGMSGSPIIQNGRLAGAVTHVLVSDPTRGYAVFAERMLDD